MIILQKKGIKKPKANWIVKEKIVWKAIMKMKIKIKYL